MASQQPVIIIKKRASHRHGHHGGAWKVAYADFVTAMMAFFLVMWLVSQNDSVKKAVSMYFSDPGAFSRDGGTGLLPGEGSSADSGGANSIQQAAASVRAALASMPQFAAIQERISVEVSDNGLHIELLETSKESFFDSGSAVLRPETIDVLAVVAREAAATGHRVAIEGHSDSRPYRDGDRYDNWELSTDRANAARRIMQKHGLGPNQVDAVKGYADTRLRYPDNPLDPRNRRISIVMQPPKG